MSEPRPDPRDWTLDQCRTWLMQHGIDSHNGDPNPYSLEYDDLAELLTKKGKYTGSPHWNLDELTSAVIAEINNQEIPGIKSWRKAVRDNLPPRECTPTPSPWKWLPEDGMIESAMPNMRNEHGHVCDLREDHSGNYNEADARLIAAAPDLLEAAQATVHSLADMPDFLEKNGNPVLAKIVAKKLARLRHVIEKATTTP